MELYVITIVVITFLISGTITYLCTMVLDAYMKRGEILDFIRLKVAKYLAKKNGIEFNTTDLENIENYETEYPIWERQERYSQLYWGIAYFDKRMNLVLCPDCMSVYIGFVISLFFCIPILINVPLFFTYKVLLIPIFWFINNLLTWKLLNWKSE